MSVATDRHTTDLGTITVGRSTYRVERTTITYDYTRPVDLITAWGPKGAHYTLWPDNRGTYSHDRFTYRGQRIRLHITGGTVSIA